MAFKILRTRRGPAGSSSTIKMVSVPRRGRSLGMASGLLAGRVLETGRPMWKGSLPLPRCGFNVHPTAMLLDDAINGSQPQAGALCRLPWW